MDQRFGSLIERCFIDPFGLRPCGGKDSVCKFRLATCLVLIYAQERLCQNTAPSSHYSQGNIRWLPEFQCVAESTPVDARASAMLKLKIHMNSSLLSSTASAADRSARASASSNRLWLIKARTRMCAARRR